MKISNRLKYFIPCLIGAMALSLASCSDDTFQGVGSDVDDGFVTVNFAIDLDVNKSLSRAEDNFPAIGDGSHINTLIYQLYDADQNIVYVPDPNDPSNEEGVSKVRVTVDKFPYEDLTVRVPKNSGYRLLLWAQSAAGDLYYETDVLKNVMFRYDNADVEDAMGQLNNSDYRDVFCANYDFPDDFGSQDVTITLHRPVAQINIGFTDEAWNLLHFDNVHVHQSSMTIVNVARRFNLYTNDVVLESGFMDGTYGDDDVDSGTNTQAYTKADFDLNTIPKYTFCDGDDFDEHNPTPEQAELYQYLWVNNKDAAADEGQDRYHWVSMSYILPPAENNETGAVDITDIKFYSKDGKDYGLPFSRLSNVPVKRNYRTNILIDKAFNATLTVDLILSTGNYDDFLNYDGTSDMSELAPGLQYRFNSNPSDYNGIKNNIDFYVSSVYGLKWLADRSNGLPYKVSDIPVYKDNKGNISYYFAKENGDPDLDAYIDFVANTFSGHGMISGGSSVQNIKNLDYWLYDECTIYLTRDIDFNDADEETRNNFIGFNCYLQYAFGGVPLNPRDPSTWTTSSGNTNPKEDRGFKGTFDGNGFTIYNMYINAVGYSDPATSDRPGNRKFTDAGLIANAQKQACVKNLRLYNATVYGDWNLGIIVGRYVNNGGDEHPGYGYSGLLIDNCIIASSNIFGVVSMDSMNDPDLSGESPSDDCNVGAILGTFAGSGNIRNCSVIDTNVYSDYVAGLMVGLTNVGNGYQNCTLQNSRLILNEMTSISRYFGAGKAIKNDRHEQMPNMLAFGNNSYSAVATGVSVIDCNMNIFVARKKAYQQAMTRPGELLNTAYSSMMGNSIISDLDLNLFPNIYTQYAHSITLKSHIKGVPDFKKSSRWKGTLFEPGADVGLYIYANQKIVDIEQQPVDKEFAYVLQGDSEDPDKLYTFNVSKRREEDVVIGVLIEGPEPVKIQNLIISGSPAMDNGVCLFDTKDITLNNVAIYDVANALQTYQSKALTGDDRARLNVVNSDLRGLTLVNTSYKDVKFTRTVFNIGSGKQENKIGLLSLSSNADLTECIFRTNFKIQPASGVKVTFSQCVAGPPALVDALTAENLERYLSPGTYTLTPGDNDSDFTLTCLSTGGESVVIN